MKVWDKKKICEKLGIPENAPILKSRFLKWIDALDGKEVKSEDMSYPVRFANDIDHLITDFTSKRPDAAYKLDIAISDHKTVITNVQITNKNGTTIGRYTCPYTTDYQETILHHVNKLFVSERRSNDND